MKVEKCRVLKQPVQRFQILSPNRSTVKIDEHKHYKIPELQYIKPIRYTIDKSSHKDLFSHNSKTKLIPNKVTTTKKKYSLYSDFEDQPLMNQKRKLVPSRQSMPPQPNINEKLLYSQVWDMKNHSKNERLRCSMKELKQEFVETEINISKVAPSSFNQQHMKSSVPKRNKPFSTIKSVNEHNGKILIIDNDKFNVNGNKSNLFSTPYLQTTKAKKQRILESMHTIDGISNILANALKPINNSKGLEKISAKLNYSRSIESEECFGYEHNIENDLIVLEETVKKSYPRNGVKRKTEIRLSLPQIKTPNYGQLNFDNL